ncbi:MAG: cobyrinate a,c-diamide synthase [Desulfohalobiaceae bacterium]|nr:cobyrinate a,c-diamide synthase [Desulfohalobiaceae bacterium]
MKLPRLLLGGLKGGSGKTIVSLGLARYFSKVGLRVKPYKKGPDYIDAVWLGRAAGKAATNLDPFFMDDRLLKALFLDKADGADLALIEGNRGLFDGKDVGGSCSSAYLARQLGAPAVLIIDCTKMSRTVAPLVQGCASFEPGLDLAGVIFNQTAGERHRRILRNCVEAYTDVPVLGALPKIKAGIIPERHMGLISDQEFAAEGAIQDCARIVADSVDCPQLLALGRAAPDIQAPKAALWPEAGPVAATVSVGVVKDACLWFYYPENLEALERAGVRLVDISLMNSDPWPELHGLYFGGGFPETQAEVLSANVQVRKRVRELAEKGLPVYAECGGLMYLCQSLTLGGTEYPMVGVFPLHVELNRRPQGHGYTLTRVVRTNPFHSLGAEFTGHEFHYSCCSPPDDQDRGHCLQMIRGTGMGRGWDGLLYWNTFACYTHLHALSVPDWAFNFARAARAYRQSREEGLPECPPIIASRFG